MTALAKIDVARRQLKTAINLFFEGSDAVSIFSLASNAWEIIDVLCNLAVVNSMSNQVRDQIPAKKNLKLDYINSPYRNFFKHAERDPDGVLENFDESAVDSIIFLAVEDYLRLIKKSPIEFQIFQLWYLATNTEKISDDSIDRILEAVSSSFPRIGELPRIQKIAMGKKVLHLALKDKELIADHRTEISL